ncbi:MAG: DNA polymerase III subunit beta [Thermofilum sp.]
MEAKTLLERLTVISSVIPAKTLPVIIGSETTASKGGTVFARNDEAMVRCALPVNPGCSVEVDGNQLVSLLRKATKGSVYVQDTGVTVVDGDFRVVVPGRKPEDEPRMPEITPGISFRLNARDLLRVLTMVVCAAGRECHQGTLNGVLLEAERGSLFFVASDAYRMHVARLHVDVPDFEAVIPREPAVGLLKALRPAADDELPVRIDVSEEKLSLSWYGVEILLTLIPGAYPPWNTVFPEGAKTAAVVERKAVLEVLKKFSPLMKKPGPLITLKTRNGCVVLSLEIEERPIAEQPVPAAVTSCFEYTFKPHYLLDTFQHLQEDRIAVICTGSFAPVSFRGTRQEEPEGVIIMPVKRQ